MANHEIVVNRADQSKIMACEKVITLLSNNNLTVEELVEYVKSAKPATCGRQAFIHKAVQPARAAKVAYSKPDDTAKGKEAEAETSGFKVRS